MWGAVDGIARRSNSNHSDLSRRVQWRGSATQPETALAQIFSVSADTRLRAVILILVLAAGGALLFMAGFAQSSYVTAVGWPRSQPVPFSHQHHVGALGIDCRYCHAEVEVSAEAGMPPTRTCMTCHSKVWTGAPMLEPVRQSLARGEPIRWNRVASVPDFVFFDHSIHVSRGVPCVECHGRVDEMPLLARAEPFQMGWCLDCHRDPAPHLRPPEEVTRMDWAGWAEANPEFGRLAMELHHIEPQRLDSCTICHR